MDSQILISVIVPVYNVEKFLPRCINSLLRQTYTNLEIILIDDGSTDHCGDICDQYKQMDPRIQVIHKDNGGLAEARNYGLEFAGGRYYSFVDSDDFVSEDYIACLYSLAVRYDAEISCCSYVPTTGDFLVESGEHNEKICVFEAKQALESLLYQKEVNTSACGKLFLATLFQEIRFPVGKLYEDVVPIFHLIEKCGRLVQTSAVKYGYFNRSTSIIRSSFSVRKMDYIDNTYQNVVYVSENCPELYKATISRYVWANIHVLLQIQDKRKFSAEYKEIRRNLKKYCVMVLTDKNVKTKNRLVLLCALFGESLLRKIYAGIKA